MFDCVLLQNNDNADGGGLDGAMTGFGLCYGDMVGGLGSAKSRMIIFAALVVYRIVVYAPNSASTSLLRRIYWKPSECV
jgi:hypothetical protein